MKSKELVDHMADLYVVLFSGWGLNQFLCRSPNFCHAETVLCTVHKSHHCFRMLYMQDLYLKEIQPRQENRPLRMGETNGKGI